MLLFHPHAVLNAAPVGLISSLSHESKELINGCHVCAARKPPGRAGALKKKKCRNESV